MVRLNNGLWKTASLIHDFNFYSRCVVRENIVMAQVGARGSDS